MKENLEIRKATRLQPTLLTMARIKATNEDKMELADIIRDAIEYFGSVPKIWEKKPIREVGHIENGKFISSGFWIEHPLIKEKTIWLAPKQAVKEPKTELYGYRLTKHQADLMQRYRLNIEIILWLYILGELKNVIASQ